jgi:hypothetical protein
LAKIGLSDAAQKSPQTGPSEAVCPGRQLRVVSAESREAQFVRDTKTLNVISGVHERGHSNVIAERRLRPTRPLE